MERAVIIGSGNLAEALAQAVARSGLKLVQLFARNAQRGKTVAALAGTQWTSDPAGLAEADIYLIAVSDRAVAEAAASLPIPAGAVVAHTAGSVPLEALPDRPTTRRAVFYPLQTFTKGREVDFSQIPVFLETDDEALRPELEAHRRQCGTSVRRAQAADRPDRRQGARRGLPGRRADRSRRAQRHRNPRPPLRPARRRPATQEHLFNHKQQHMGNFKEDIARTEAFVFDVDGVMTDGGIIPTLDGDFIRRYNAKDGYALAYAIKMGYKVCIITGGRGKTLENRLKMLGVTRAYIDCMDKISALHEYFAEEGIDPRNAIYMGDDIPDLECMREVGIPVCPADAAAEVIEASRYVSEFKGGEGAVRDIVEQVLRARGDWAKNSEGVTPSSLAASR